jgi:hypothetical protein
MVAGQPRGAIGGPVGRVLSVDDALGSEADGRRVDELLRCMGEHDGVAAPESGAQGADVGGQLGDGDGSGSADQDAGVVARQMQMVLIHV